MSLDFHPRKMDLLCSSDSNNEIRLWDIKEYACLRVSKVNFHRLLTINNTGDCSTILILVISSAFIIGYGRIRNFTIIFAFIFWCLFIVAPLLYAVNCFFLLSDSETVPLQVIISKGHLFLCLEFLITGCQHVVFHIFAPGLVITYQGSHTLMYTWKYLLFIEHVLNERFPNQLDANISGDISSITYLYTCNSSIARPLMILTST